MIGFAHVDYNEQRNIYCSQARRNSKVSSISALRPQHQLAPLCPSYIGEVEALESGHLLAMFVTRGVTQIPSSCQLPKEQAKNLSIALLALSPLHHEIIQRVLHVSTGYRFTNAGTSEIRWWNRGIESTCPCMKEAQVTLTGE